MVSYTKLFGKLHKTTWAAWGNCKKFKVSTRDVIRHNHTFIITAVHFLEDLWAYVIWSTYWHVRNSLKQILQWKKLANMGLKIMKNLFVSGGQGAQRSTCANVFILAVISNSDKCHTDKILDQSRSDFMTLVPRTSNWGIYLWPTTFTCPGEKDNLFFEPCKCCVEPFCDQNGYLKFITRGWLGWKWEGLPIFSEVHRVRRFNPDSGCHTCLLK